MTIDMEEVLLKSSSSLMEELRELAACSSYHDVLIVCQAGETVTCSTIFLAAGLSNRAPNSVEKVT